MYMNPNCKVTYPLSLPFHFSLFLSLFLIKR